MSRFKTEMCNNLIELGTCKYGDRCHYAHGAHELRQVSRRHPKYRTERCKNFEITGKCPFGPRCSYVHPKPDLDSMIEQLTRYMKHQKAPEPDPEDDCGGPMAVANITQRRNTLLSNSSLQNTSSMSRTPLGNSNYLNNLNRRDQVGNQGSLSSGLGISASANNLHHPQQQQHQQQNELSKAFYQASSTNNSSKSSLISEDSTSPNTISIASNPFGINNPLSDFVINTSLYGRSHLTPNKQFYTRF